MPAALADVVNLTRRPNRTSQLCLSRTLETAVTNVPCCTECINTVTSNAALLHAIRHQAHVLGSNQQPAVSSSCRLPVHVTGPKNNVSVGLPRHFPKLFDRRTHPTPSSFLWSSC